MFSIYLITLRKRMEHKVVVVTPVYKKDITESELMSIKSIVNSLERYDKVVVAPKKFTNDKDFIETWKNFGYSVKFLDDKHFKDILSYNKLMLNVEFYNLFIDYDYMLICQLDVLIFSDSLDYWISKNLDYVGAPWVVKYNNDKKFLGAGNGGLSLRKIKTFIDVLKSKQFFYKLDSFNNIPMQAKLKNIILLKILISNKIGRKFTQLFRYLFEGNEDIFWTYYATFFVQEFKVATIKDSLKFAFEEYPEFCFEQNNNTLPFGTHAWEKYNIDFWKKYQIESIQKKNI